MKAESKSAASAAQTRRLHQQERRPRRGLFQEDVGDYFAPLRRDILHDALTSFTLASREVTEGDTRLELYWKIEALTANDLNIFLQALERSLTETACEVLLGEGVSKQSLDAYEDGKGLLDLKIVHATIGSFKIHIDIEFTSRAKSESWFKSVAKGILKRVAIGWISAIIMAGPNPGGPPASIDPAAPGAKSVPGLVASLAQTGKPSTLIASVPGERRAFFSIPQPEAA
jgi:hypothetical protein